MRCSISAAVLSLFCLTQLVVAAPWPVPASVDLTIGIDGGSDSANSNSTGSDSKSSGSWTVIVDNDDPRTLEELMAELGVDACDLKHVYNNSAFKGFTGPLSNLNLNKMSVMSGFKTFEPEIDIALYDTQFNAPWGLQRISQKNSIANPPSKETVGNNTFKYQFDGSLETLGVGVDIYVIDTGINANHIDFDGRASVGFSIDNMPDSEGHGTHCAGIAGSTTFGVAKAANVIAVKVFSDGTGSSGDILKGLDFLVNSHDQRKTTSGWNGSVASMSVGSSNRSTSLDEAVARASEAGIHIVVAAGNDNQDACNSSPAAVAGDSAVISVGSINIEDRRSSFSNFAKCTTLFAPGEKITSTWIGGDNTINTISGTSMSCPYVAGLVAYHLASHPSLATDTAGMKKLITSNAVTIEVDKGKVLLANNGITTPASKRNFDRTFDMLE